MKVETLFSTIQKSYKKMSYFSVSIEKSKVEC